jgi:transcriptional regulator with XRE-family HTH domain
LSNTPERLPDALVELKKLILNGRRTLRSDQNLQREVLAIARASGVDRNTIWRWLEGKTQNPNIDEVDKVARVLGFRLELIQFNKKARSA